MKKLLIVIGIGIMLVVVVGLGKVYVDSQIEKATIGSLTSDEVISRVKEHLINEDKGRCPELAERPDGWSATFDSSERAWLVTQTHSYYGSKFDGNTNNSYMDTIWYRWDWKYYEESDSVVRVDIQDEHSRTDVFCQGW